MRRTAAALLLAGMVGSTWVLSSPGMTSAIEVGPIAVTVPTVTAPVTVPVVGSTVSTVLEEGTVTTLPPVTAPASPVPLPEPLEGVVGAVPDCASFATQAAAQAAMALDPTLAAVLDEDGDGTACELLSTAVAGVPGVPDPVGGDAPGDGDGIGSGSTASGGGGRTSAAGVPSGSGTGGSPPAATAGTASPVGSVATSTAGGGLPGTGRRVGSAPRSGPGVTESAAASPVGASRELSAEASDGGAPAGRAVATAIAIVLLLGTAAGAVRRWQLDGGLAGGASLRT